MRRNQRVRPAVRAAGPRQAVRRIGRPSGRRTGSALLVVLVVVTLLSLAAYSFSQLMVVEARATRHYSQDAQARELANSAVDYTAAMLGNPIEEVPNYYHNPGLFTQVPVVVSDDPVGEGWFSIVAPVESDIAARAVRFGLMNESARVNINAIVKYDMDEDLQRIFRCRCRT
ncbi:MAG: hypothetical protein R3B90_05675 [Planctomycetaceae bacterium]